MATLEQRMTWLAERLRKLAVEAEVRRGWYREDSTSYHSENAVVDCYNYAARAIDIELAQADTVAQPEQVVPFSSNAQQGMNPSQLDAIVAQQGFICERLQAIENFNIHTAGKLDCLYDTLRQALGVIATGGSSVDEAQAAAPQGANAGFSRFNSGPLEGLRRYSAGVLTTVYAEALCPSAARDAMLDALADAEEAAALKCVELEWELSEWLVDEELSECLEDEGEVEL